MISFDAFIDLPDLYVEIDDGGFSYHGPAELGEHELTVDIEAEDLVRQLGNYARAELRKELASVGLPKDDLVDLLFENGRPDNAILRRLLTNVVECLLPVEDNETV